jgi:hypothetical protein
VEFMAQSVFYSDDRVQVSGNSVIFDNTEYELAHATRASLRRQGEASQIDERATAFALLYLLWFIVRLLLRAAPNPVFSLAASIGMVALARQVRKEWKEPRPKYNYAIELHGPSGTAEVFTSTDGAYLRKIVAAINHAVEGGMTEGQREALEKERRRRRHRGSGGRSSPGSRHRGHSRRRHAMGRQAHAD